MRTASEWLASAWSHTHSEGGTHSIIEWVLVGLAACTVTYALYKAVRHLLDPGETSPDHIKLRILDDGEHSR